MSATVGQLAPDYAEPFEAWRAWRVLDRDGVLALASVVRGTVWPAREALVAECLRRRTVGDRVRRNDHDAPDADCECGIYATSLDRCGEYLDQSLPESLARVYGRVALWGEVIECERGFRASRAYPVELYVPCDACRDARATPEDIAERLERYGVPVEVVDASRSAPFDARRR